MKDFLVIGGLIGMMACTNRVTSRQAEFDRNMVLLFGRGKTSNL